MLLPLRIYAQGRLYELRSAGLRARATETGRVLTRYEAESVLRNVMRGFDSCNATELRGLYREVANDFVITHVSNETILCDLLTRLDEGRGFGDFTIVEVNPFARWQQASAEPTDPREVLRIEGLLKDLGPADLRHRGDVYRIVLAHNKAMMAEGHLHEAVADREAATLLRQMAGETTRPAQQKTALTELAAQFTKPRVEPAAKLVVVRRIRTYARAATDDAPALTPSQLRKAREAHWVEIALVDKRLGPLAGEALDITLPDGRKQRGITNEQGLFRIDGIPGGTCRILFKPTNGHPPKSADTQWNKLELGVNVGTDAQRKFEVEHNRAEIIEVDDAQFCPNSSVLVPNDSEQRGLHGLSMAAHALRYASENAGRKLMIVGHANDDESDRAALAEKRAKVLEAVLKGDAQAFVAACVDRDQAATPLLLGWASERHGYDCDPGAKPPVTPASQQHDVDPLQAALGRFRRDHNEREKAQLDEAAQGMVAADYEAFFKLYERSLADQLDVELSELSSVRSKLKLHSVPTLGAESDWPKPTGAGAKQLRSPSSRRVDLMFLENDHPIPKPDDTAVSAEHFFADERRVRRNYLPPRGALVVVTPYTSADIDKGADAAFKLVGPGYSNTIKLSERSKHAKDHFDVKYTELEFNLIPTDGKYKLSVTPAGGAESVVFENVPFAELLDDGAVDDR